MKTSPLIGFMQGRLSPLVDGKIQAFPWQHWRHEFPLAAQYGFSCMEWTLDHEGLYENPLMTHVGQLEIKRLCETYGLTIPSLTGDFFMHAPLFKVEGVERQARLDDLASILDHCLRMNIRYLVIPLVDHGGLRGLEDEENVIAALDAVMTPRKGEPISIIFESDYPPTQLAALMQHFPAPTYGINYDIGNSAALGFDVTEEMAAYGSRILNVHVKDRLLAGTTVPLGSGNANLPHVIQSLVKTGYQGRYILQTARAADGEHEVVLSHYRDRVMGWLPA